MKNFIYKFSLLFFTIVFISYAGQSSGLKVKKAPAPASVKKILTATQMQSKILPAIGKNFSQFLNRAGVRKNINTVSNASVQSNNVFANAFGFKLPLQKPDNAGGSVNRIVYNKNSNTPRLIEMNVPAVQKTKTVQSALAKETVAQNFLAANKELLKINDPSKEFSLKNSLEDKLGMTHIKYKQMYKGLEVWGNEIVVHLDSRGNVVSLNGEYQTTPSTITDINSKLDGAAAVSKAIEDLSVEDGIKTLLPEMAKMLNYNGPVAQKVIWFDDGNTPHLVWNIEIRNGISQYWQYFIDANSGAVLNRFNSVCFDGIQNATARDLNGVNQTFSTYQVGSKYYLVDASQNMFNAAQSTIPSNPVGAIVTNDLRNTDLSSGAQMYYITSTDNTWSDRASISAQYNAIQTYKYYSQNFNRNSIDDKGMTITSLIHVTENGQSMENAFWNETVMCYGDGGSLFKPLAGGLDVGAHEMTHGVTQYTANLAYENQSGALNESMSDVFGALVDSSNWTMGESIVRDLSTFPSGSLRNMANPHNGSSEGNSAWQPAKMSEFQNLSNDENHDYGGVHTNSGIPNRAFYLAATQIGRRHAGQIWYRALTVYLTRLSQFVDARIATEKAAADLYGANSADVQAVKSAWDGVEVYEGNSTPAPTPTQLVGEQWVLAVNTASSDPNSIYMAKTKVNSNSDFFALSKTSVLTKPAVTDTSGIILFVDGDHDLKAIFASTTTPLEETIDTSGVWESVAVGPGLNSIALTSKYQDTTIYYINIEKNITKDYKIVSRSFDGTLIKTALYAEALSFDPTGQYVLFDTYNEIKKSDGTTSSYWTINILNLNNDIISGVFPPQSEGIDIGNPSFAKTSPYRFTFDYLDNTANQDYVMAADFNTGQSGIVATVKTVPGYTIIGFPSYSADDKTIVYHTAETVSGVEHDAIEQMPLKDNFIEGTGTSQPYIIDATYPSWFVIGSRITDVPKNNGELPTNYVLSQNYPNPFNPTTRIDFSIPQRGQVILKVYDLLGREVAVIVNGMFEAGNHEVEFNANKLTSGIYFYTIKTNNFTQTKKMIVLR